MKKKKKVSRKNKDLLKNSLTIALVVKTIVDTVVEIIKLFKTN